MAKRGENGGFGGSQIYQNITRLKVAFCGAKKEVFFKAAFMELKRKNGVF